MTVADLLVGYLVAPTPDTYYWNKLKGKYYRAIGEIGRRRAVAWSTIQKVGEHYTAERIFPAVQALTDRFLSGSLTLADWQERMARTIKDGRIINLHLGRGGRTATTFSDYGKIGADLRMEYRRLESFAQEIASGKLSEAQIRARADQYAAGVRKAYWIGRTAGQKEAGLTHEARFLSPVEHCAECPEYAARGIVPIGTLPEPGFDCTCSSNCKCYKVYYTIDEAGNFKEA